MEEPEGEATAPAPSLLCSHLSKKGGAGALPQRQEWRVAEPGFCSWRFQCLSVSRCRAQELETLLEVKLKFSPSTRWGPSPHLVLLLAQAHPLHQQELLHIVCGAGTELPWGPAKLTPHTAALCTLPVGRAFLKPPPTPQA